MSASVTVTDAADRSRFEARVGGEFAGFCRYIRTADLVVYPHTEVEPAFEGKGVGGPWPVLPSPTPENGTSR
jgi:hypothetical protein